MSFSISAVLQKVLKKVAIRGFCVLHKRKITIHLCRIYFDNFTYQNYCTMPLE